MKKRANKFRDMPFAQLTREVARLRAAEPSETARFEVMDLAEVLMEHHDRMHPGDFTRESVRSWIGQMQARQGFQDYEAA